MWRKSKPLQSLHFSTPRDLQIHHATVLVSDGQNHSLHLRHGHDGEGLSVQLHTIRGTTERSLGTRLPVRSGCALHIPVGRNRSHLVEPIGRNADGGTAQIVVGVISLNTVVASLQDHLLLALGNEVVNGDVGILNPIGGGVIERHIKTVLGDTEQVGPLFGGRMIMTCVHLVDELVV